MRNYEIAGIGCSFSEGGVPLEERSSWERFRSEYLLKPVFSIFVRRPERFQYGMEFFTPEQDVAHVIRLQSGILLADRGWTRGEVLSLTEQSVDVHAFAAQMFCTAAVRRQMLQIHGAVVEDQGRGVLFLGPSGIGKTTQAERWAMYRGSVIINGDMTYIQYTSGSCKAWGTPWHGSSPYCLNASVPLKALVVLKQSEENRLRELKGFEKVREVSGSVFYPTWLEDGMELCMDTMDHLLTCVPVYRLDNRADQEAVDLLSGELDRICP